MTMAVSMAFAGSETTAISLSAVFYYLLKNPRCMNELVKELDERGREGYFKDNEMGVVTWTESQSLPYLDACVKEAFRLHPAPGLPLERVVPEQGAEIAGHWVKGGTIVGCSAWVIHRRPEIFGEDFEVYRPERWLVDESKDKDSEEKRIKEMSGTMLQFGMGARTCIGKNISLLEIYKLVPTVLRRFEVCRSVRKDRIFWTSADYFAGATRRSLEGLDDLECVVRKTTELPNGLPQTRYRPTHQRINLDPDNELILRFVSIYINISNLIIATSIRAYHLLSTPPNRTVPPLSPALRPPQNKTPTIAQ